MWILEKIDTAVTWFVRTVIVILLFVMLVTGLMQVLSRYVFNFGFSWSEEFIRFVMLWAAFLSAGIGVRENKHIGLDLIVSRLREPGRRRVRIVMNIIVTLLLTVFWYLALRITLFMRDMTSPMMQIPRSIWYMSVLSGFTLMVFYLIRNISLEVRKEE